MPSFQPFEDISHLIFPNRCLSCEKELSRNDAQLCAFCSAELTLTNFHTFTGPSPMDKLFWGRVEICATYAHLYFEKGKTVQDVLFSLKYKNNKSIGTYFGKEIGVRIKQIDKLKSLDAIIPVPLHPKKEFIRGYNQSEAIAKGISESSEIPLHLNLLKRAIHSQSQTKKDRFQRWDNVSGIFKVNPAIKQFQHIALVDDMITTGSTIESMIQAVQKENPAVSVSVITLAIAV